ncbi:SDR family NAD(P)-dependent oxidoreductase [Planotetraspora kaengkrachanensis]|uniref:Short-chain dehydrogenase/reductase n=1 Tax=Planotetraspora kaengkrachanensis TaxID=575193 RepID=A0A8J3VBE1_9ACTN|nr:SDR family NAD(P)-dependent oxidoreductase [Planotetraspora kaengkrachanensis]GIG83893.1 short-chain dehydrogenase/reductase [Planotetraspora kaengkrachanensis]
MQLLTNAKTRTLLVTGGSRGLGRALAEAALARGHQVVVTARDAAKVRDLVDEHPAAARAVTLDVTDPRAADAAVRTAVEEFGRLDVLVNNAGYSDIASIEDTGLDDFRAQVETNLWGAVHLTKAALPVLREQRGGHVVQVSSVSGRLAPAVGLGAYVTAKFALEGFSEALAAEVAPFGVKVTIVEPGSMATTLASSMRLPRPSAPYAEAMEPMLRRYGDPHAAYGVSPRRAAEVLLGVLDLPDPPLRLPLSGAAFDRIREGEQRKIAELDRWEDLSRSADT